MDHAGLKFNYREFFGNVHFMKQLQRQYEFPVSVYKENENGNRTFLRSEGSLTYPEASNC